MDSPKSISIISSGKSVSRIRFFSLVPREVPELHGKPVKARYEMCEFTLGLGRCGRVVSRLWYLNQYPLLHITQESYEKDGQTPEFKEFTYRIEQITGRIETTHSA